MFLMFEEELVFVPLQKPVEVVSFLLDAEGLDEAEADTVLRRVGFFGSEDFLALKNSNQNGEDFLRYQPALVKLEDFLVGYFEAVEGVDSVAVLEEALFQRGSFFFEVCRINQSIEIRAHVYDRVRRVFDPVILAVVRTKNRVEGEVISSEGNFEFCYLYL